MKRRFGPLTAVLIACLCVPEAHASRGSGSHSPKEPLEFRQLVYIRSIDEKGADYADRLSAVFVYLHRQGGVTFTMDPISAIVESPRARMLLTKGIVTDAGVRASVQEWMKLSVSTATADFDSLGSTEGQFLSRDAFSQALLSSPRFWQRLGEISRTENFDFRPVLRREIRALQFAGNAVSWVAIGGLFGAAFRFLKLGWVALVAITVPAVTVTGAQLWQLNQSAADETPTKESMMAKIENRQTENEFSTKILHEHQRRLVILTKVRELQVALAQGSIADLKRTKPELTSEVIQLKPMLENYKAKMQADQLPIKRSDDQARVRSDVAAAVDFLIETATELSK